jgi:hypothetical protein
MLMGGYGGGGMGGGNDFFSNASNMPIMTMDGHGGGMGETSPMATSISMTMPGSGLAGGGNFTFGDNSNFSGTFGAGTGGGGGGGGGGGAKAGSGQKGGGSKRSRQQRVNLPKDAKDYLSSWLYYHLDNPYPSEDEKKQLATNTKLTFDQVNNWFINSRARMWKPLVSKVRCGC